MNYNQFRNLSCYEEFEIQCDLIDISKIDVLREMGDIVEDYYFFVSLDGIFNWFDSNGNHVKDPSVLKTIIETYIPPNITKCVIPDSVTSIGAYAFYNCKSLKEVTIPNSVRRISYSAFENCESLKEIIIPDSVQSIDDYAFYNCNSLEKVTISDSIANISRYAFANCDLVKEIISPNSVTRIGDYAFCHCISLNNVIFKGKTLEEVKGMMHYPFGLGDESIIKCEK